jgi:polyisoprenoid-binding protein YceI
MGQTHWTIDTAHSQLSFSVRHLMVARVQGTFRRWSGQAEIDVEDLSRGKAEITIEVDSIDTRDAARDSHLRSADFFDAQTFPQLRFSSTRVSRRGQKRLALEGELEMHGVKKPVTVDAEFLGRRTDPSGAQRLFFGAQTTIHRKSWGLEWNQALELGGALVGEQVQVKAQLQFVGA